MPLEAASLPDHDRPGEHQGQPDRPGEVGPAPCARDVVRARPRQPGAERDGEDREQGEREQVPARQGARGERQPDGDGVPAPAFLGPGDDAGEQRERRPEGEQLQDAQLVEREGDGLGEHAAQDRGRRRAAEATGERGPGDPVERERGDQHQSVGALGPGQRPDEGERHPGQRLRFAPGEGAGVGREDRGVPPAGERVGQPVRGPPERPEVEARHGRRRFTSERESPALDGERPGGRDRDGDGHQEGEASGSTSRDGGRHAWHANGGRRSPRAGGCGLRRPAREPHRPGRRPIHPISRRRRLQELP